MKQYTLICALVLCMSSNIMQGHTEQIRCHHIVINKLIRLFYQLKQVAEMQSTPVNKYTAKVQYYSNSKRVDIYLKNGEQYTIDDYSNQYIVNLIKGAPHNFYEIVHWDDRTNHPLYPFLRENGILDSKNAPNSLPKTIM